jgi:hypothetical protein
MPPRVEKDENRTICLPWVTKVEGARLKRWKWIHLKRRIFPSTISSLPAREERQELRFVATNRFGNVGQRAGRGGVRTSAAWQRGPVADRRDRTAHLIG